MQLRNNSALQNGKYRIIRVLGQGGFGITYLAENVLLDKKVAIKEFFPKEYCDRDSTSRLTLGTQNNAETVARLKDRFLKEAKNIAKLDHPGIIRIHDVFEENNTAYYVMDYIEGENLNEMVKRIGPLSEAKAIEYIRKVGDALEYIHAHHMTHFDVKPANIMVRNSDNVPILIDFGLSKQYDFNGDATSTIMQGVSHGFSPIELYNTGAITSFSPQTDVYSLAATLLYLITGTIPPSPSQIAEDGLIIPQNVTSSINQAISQGMNTSRAKRSASINTFLSLFPTTENVSSFILPATKQEAKESTHYIGIEEQKTNRIDESSTTVETKINSKWIWGSIVFAVIICIFVFASPSYNKQGGNISDDSTFSTELKTEKLSIDEQIQNSSPWIIEAPNFTNEPKNSKVLVPKITQLSKKYKEPDIDHHMVGSCVPTQSNKGYEFITSGGAYCGYLNLMIIDTTNDTLLKNYSFENFKYSPKYIEADKEFIDQYIQQAYILDDVLYISHYHTTYAASSCGMNGYISAINLKTNKIIWTSKPLVCNSDFVIYGDYIITGYGFTDETDYLYVLEKSTGAVLKRISLANGPECITIHGNRIYVRTYSYEYIFEIQ